MLNLVFAELDIESNNNNNILVMLHPKFGSKGYKVYCQINKILYVQKSLWFSFNIFQITYKQYMGKWKNGKIISDLFYKL
jgi:hypothetical protein